MNPNKTTCNIGSCSGITGCRISYSVSGGCATVNTILDVSETTKTIKADCLKLIITEALLSRIFGMPEPIMEVKFR